MRRALCLLRQTVPLRCVQAAALRPTRVLYIHPQLARLIVAGGLLVFQAFITAHNNEARKLQQEEKKEANGNHNMDPMSSTEALQVLGLDAHLSLPLQRETDRQEATRRFRRFFSIAKESNNLYLQGKFSAAYRLCVDADWDSGNELSNNRDTGSTGGQNTKN